MVMPEIYKPRPQKGHVGTTSRDIEEHNLSGTWLVCYTRNKIVGAHVINIFFTTISQIGDFRRSGWMNTFYQLIKAE